MVTVASEPSADYLALVGTSAAGLTAVVRRGERPDVDNLVGWEYRGTNVPATSRLLGIRRFVKGFHRVGPDRVEGYNQQVRGADLTTSWTPRRRRDGRLSFGAFAVGEVDPTAIDNRYLHALLLDYGAVAHPEPGIAGHLRDYLVRVVPGRDDLLVGHAFLALGRARVPVGWFVLERMAPASQPDAVDA